MTFIKGQRAWNKGIPITPEAREKLSRSKTGKKVSAETKMKMRLAHLGVNNHFFGKNHDEAAKSKMRGENNGNWKGGISPINHLIRESSDYKLWREAVFKRDNWTCVECGLKRGWNKELKRRVNLQADHIKPFSLFPELRFAINNGRSLCAECHRKTPTWGVNVKYYMV